MKKIMALLLCLALTLGSLAALAEEGAEKTRLGTLKVGQAFALQSRLPENYVFTLTEADDLHMVGQLSGGEGDAVVYISIAYSEEYADVERFNDLDEAAVEKIRASFSDMDEVAFEDLETAHGTRLLKVTTADKTFADIYTIYRGYELEFVLTAPGGVTDEDIQMLVDFISDMDFVEVE